MGSATWTTRLPKQDLSVCQEMLDAFELLSFRSNTDFMISISSRDQNAIYCVDAPGAPAICAILSEADEVPAKLSNYRILVFSHTLANHAFLGKYMHICNRISRGAPPTSAWKYNFLPNSAIRFFFSLGREQLRQANISLYVSHH